MTLSVECMNHVGFGSNRIICRIGAENGKFSDMREDTKITLFYGSFQSDASFNAFMTPSCEYIQKVYEDENNCVGSNFCGHVTAPVSYGRPFEYTLSRNTPGSYLELELANGTEYICKDPLLNNARVLCIGQSNSSYGKLCGNGFTLIKHNL